MERAPIREGTISTDELGVLYKTMASQYQSAIQCLIYQTSSSVTVHEAKFV